MRRRRKKSSARRRRRDIEEEEGDMSGEGGRRMKRVRGMRMRRGLGEMRSENWRGKGRNSVSPVLMVIAMIR